MRKGDLDSLSCAFARDFRVQVDRSQHRVLAPHRTDRCLPNPLERCRVLKLCGKLGSRLAETAMIACRRPALPGSRHRGNGSRAACLRRRRLPCARPRFQGSLRRCRGCRKDIGTRLRSGRLNARDTRRDGLLSRRRRHGRALRRQSGDGRRRAGGKDGFGLWRVSMHNRRRSRRGRMRGGRRLHAGCRGAVRRSGSRRGRDSRPQGRLVYGTALILHSACIRHRGRDRLQSCRSSAFQDALSGRLRVCRCSPFGRTVRHRGLSRLERLHAFRQGRERQVGVWPHHAREPDFERQSRVRRRAQLCEHIAQHAHQVRQPIGTVVRHLAHQFATFHLAHVERDVGACHAQDVHIPEMLRQIPRELRQVGACFNVARRPSETCCNIAHADSVHNLCHVLYIERTEHVLSRFQGDFPLPERDDLLERCERVAHAAFGTVRNQFECFAFELHVFRHADSAQARNDGFRADAAEVEPLTARMDGLRNFLGVRSAEDEHNMVRRFFQGLQQRIEGRRGQHVNLVDDVDLFAAARRRELDAPDDLFAHVLHARAACGIQFVDVRVRAGRNLRAVLARAVRIGRGTVLAEQGLRQKARRGGLARTARSAEQVGMAHFVLLDGVANSALDMVLAHHVSERLRTVFPVQSL